jgi:hypothetical protein
MVMEVPPLANGHGDTPRCGARLRQSEGRCRKTAGWGTTHVGTGRCRLHGGSTARQTAGAERRQVEDGARRILADLGAATPIDNPLVELQQLAGEVVTLKNALRGMVEKLTSIQATGDSSDTIRAEIVVYERALDRCTRVLVDMARLNLDERLAAITEHQADAIVVVLTAGLAAAGIVRGSEQDRRARAAIAQAFRALPRPQTTGSEAEAGRVR